MTIASLVEKETRHDHDHKKKEIPRQEIGTTPETLHLE
jgi:hypothetical protein